ncbi:Cytochrome p450 6k1 [Gryllus bimaculatus]|nr:Cytochrome p450 6k1 [Gryllus bimaculatus]
MDGDVLVAQALSFLAAGFDTTSTTMSYALYELAMNEDIQEKLRTQLQETMQKHDGKLTYQALQCVNYLDMIFSETLRKYPVYPFLDRTCTKTYRVPGTDIVLDKGVFAFTSILGIQRDPQYFPEPERFDPERFSDANRGNIPSCCFMSSPWVLARKTGNCPYYTQLPSSPLCINA